MLTCYYVCMSYNADVLTCNDVNIPYDVCVNVIMFMDLLMFMCSCVMLLMC